MAGTLTLTTLSDGTNSTSATNPIRGSAKAWCNWQGGDGTTAGVINNSYNVSSITVNSAGNHIVNFTSAMPNANYVVVGGASRSDATTYGPYVLGVNSASAPTTTAVNVIVGYSGSRASGGIPLTFPQAYIAIFSS